MKKAIIILAIAGIFILPTSGFAITRSDQDVQDRLVSLESQVANLQVQIKNVNDAMARIQSQPVAPVAPTYQAPTTDNLNVSARLASVENRVSILEKTVNFILSNVSNVLSEVIKFLNR